MPLLIGTIIYLSFCYGFLREILAAYNTTQDTFLLESALLFWFVVTVCYCFWHYKTFKKELGKKD